MSSPSNVVSTWRVSSTSAMLFAAPSYHVVIRASDVAMSVRREKMAELHESIMVHVQQYVTGRTLTVRMDVPRPATPGNVGLVSSLARCDASTLGVIRNARSLVFHAQNSVIGTAHIMGRVSFLVQYPAKSCLARKGVNRSYLVVISALHYVGRYARRLNSARFALPRRSRITRWITLWAHHLVRPILTSRQ